MYEQGDQNNGRPCRAESAHIASKEDMKEVGQEIKDMEGKLTTRLDRMAHLLLEEQKRALST